MNPDKILDAIGIIEFNRVDAITRDTSGIKGIMAVGYYLFSCRVQRMQPVTASYPHISFLIYFDRINNICIVSLLFSRLELV